jgi:hypothetical protein
MFVCAIFFRTTTPKPDNELAYVSCELAAWNHTFYQKNKGALKRSPCL